MKKILTSHFVTSSNDLFNTTQPLRNEVSNNTENAAVILNYKYELVSSSTEQNTKKKRNELDQAVVFRV